MLQLAQNVLNTQEEKNVQVEIINWSKGIGGYVYYFENTIEAHEKLTELITKYPNDEIGVSHFSVFGYELPFTEENIEFVENADDSELEFIIEALKNGYATHQENLSEVMDYLENNHCYYVISGENNYKAEHAFIDYIEETGGVEYIKNKEYYFDYEAFKRDCELEGDEEIAEMSMDDFEWFCDDCGILENSELVERYFDFEKLMFAFECDGMTTIELSNGDYVFMF